MRRALHLTFLLCAAVGLLSCRGCGAPSWPATALELPPADAALVVSIPELGAMIKQVNAFLARATGKGGNDALARSRENLTKQLGFDPLAVEAYAAGGLDVGGSVLLFSEGAGPELLLALPCKDEAAVERMLRGLIEKTDGANRFTSATLHGFSTTTAGRPFGDEVVPAFQWAIVGRYVLVARESGRAAWEKALARLAAAKAAPTPAPSLKQEAVFLRLSRKVPPAVAQVFVRGEAAQGVLEGKPMSGAAITSITLGDAGLGADTFLELPVPGLTEAFAGPPTRPLAARVEGNAAAVFLANAAGARALAALRQQPQLAQGAERGLRELGAAIGLDAEKEVLPLLAGPLTASLHVTDLTGLPQRLKERRSLASLLDFIHVVVTAEVNDRAKFLAMLERSRATLQSRGLPLRERRAQIGNSEAHIFEPDRPTPRLGWALWRDTYVYGAGPGSLERALHAQLEEEKSLSKDLAGSVAAELSSEPGTMVLIVRGGRIAGSARQLVVGGGVGVAALVGAALGVLETLDDVALGISAESDGLRLRLRERLR